VKARVWVVTNDKGNVAAAYSNYKEATKHIEHYGGEFTKVLVQEVFISEDKIRR
jgi:hypothetical protein